MKKIRTQIYVSGKVQNIAFYNYVEKHAKQLNLYGWIRKVIGGRVEILLDGDDELIEEMIELCKKPSAVYYVLDIEINELPRKGKLQDFNFRGSF